MATLWLTGAAQDMTNLRMDRDALGLRGAVTRLTEADFHKKDYFRDDWSQRRWFRKDLRNILQEGLGHSYEFNAQGRLLKATYTKQGKETASDVCAYDRRGRLTSFLGRGYKMEACYEGNTALIDIYAETRHYVGADDLGSADLGITEYKLSYPFAYVCRQTLNDEGMPLRSVYLNVDSTVEREVRYTYAYHGKVAEERILSYGGGATPEETVLGYAYDGNGLLARRTVSGKAANETYVYERNSQGDCVRMTAERPYGTDVYTYDYDYDEEGNWTLRLTFKNGAFDHATLRTIAYAKKGRTPATDTPKRAEKDATDEPGAPKAAATEERTTEERATPVEEVAREGQEEMRRDQPQSAQRELTKEQRKEAKKAAKAERKAAEQAAKEAQKEQERLAKEQAKAAEKAAKEQARIEAKAAKRAAKAAEKEAMREARQ